MKVGTHSQMNNNIIFVTDSPQNHYVSVPTIDSIRFKESFLSLSSQPFLLDLETTGLSFNKNEVLLIAIAPYDLSVFFVIDYVGSSKDNINYALNCQTNNLICGHNLGFDLPFLMERNVRFKRDNIYDTMIVEQVLVKGTTSSVSLNNTIERRCGVKPLDKDVRKEFPLMSPHNPVFSDRHIIYASEDLAYLPQVMRSQQVFLEKYDQTELAELNNKTVYVVAKMKVAGMPVDKNAWYQLYLDNIKRSDHLEIELDDELRKLGINQRERKKERSFQLTIGGDPVDVVNKNIGNINYGSPFQLLDIFYTLNLPRPTKSREDKESMGEASVRQYMIKHKKSPIIPFLNKLLEYKDVSKQANTFGKKWIEKFYDEDGRVRSNFKVNSTATGRFACSDPNLQQIPSKKQFRDCFKAPEGYKVWTADYASAELRIMASLSGDKVMLDLLNRDADLHGYAATKVLRYLKNDDTLIVDKQNNTKFRTAMKNVIFGLSYGAGIAKIAELLDISRDRAIKVYDLLSDIFPQAFEMLEKNSKFGVQHGYIVFDRVLNQRRWFENLLKGDRSSSTISSVERACKNSPIQGINGQMIKKALVDIDNYVEANNLKSHIISTVHDEIVMLVFDGEEEHCEHFHRLMADAGTYFLSGIEMKVESVLGESWSK